MLSIKLWHYSWIPKMSKVIGSTKVRVQDLVDLTSLSKGASSSDIQSSHIRRWDGFSQMFRSSYLTKGKRPALWLFGSTNGHSLPPNHPGDPLAAQARKRKQQGIRVKMLAWERYNMQAKYRWIRISRSIWPGRESCTTSSGSFCRKVSSDKEAYYRLGNWNIYFEIYHLSSWFRAFVESLILS